MSYWAHVTIRLSWWKNLILVKVNTLLGYVSRSLIMILTVQIPSFKSFIFSIIINLLSDIIMMLDLPVSGTDEGNRFGIPDLCS